MPGKDTKAAQQHISLCHFGHLETTCTIPASQTQQRNMVYIVYISPKHTDIQMFLVNSNQ